MSRTPPIRKTRAVRQSEGRFLSWMGRFLFGMSGLLCVLPVVGQDDASKAQDRIAALIVQLGDEDFITREVAQSKLLEQGLRAFDQLHIAQNHDDIEIAKRATFLIRSIHIPWAMRTDGPEVRRILSGYAEKNTADRKSHMQRLAALPDYQGIAALSRMVRYESSNRLSRYAALQIMNQTAPAEPALRTEYIQQLRTLHQESHRIPARWVEAFASTIERPVDTVEVWDGLTRQEELLLSTFPKQTSRILVRDLLRWQFQLLRGLDRAEAATDVARRSVNLLDGSREQLIEAIDWFASEESWEFSELIAERFPIEFREYPELLYRLAESHLRADNQELATRAAMQALGTNKEDLSAHLAIASWLATQQHYDWAIAEYEQCIDQSPLESDTGVRLRVLLAELFHDLGREERAAETLQGIMDNRDQSAVVMAVRRYYPSFESLESRFLYYQACDAELKMEFAQQRMLLEKALNIDPHDGDVLIAAYRFTKADESWKQNTLKFIAASAAFYAQEVDTLEKKIRTTLDRTAKQQLEYELARACNQYAWVVSNTVGDYKQAVKFSERSLDLRGWELAGYLDTLSHTYFAVKDYENAVKYQTKAVKLDPASQLMRQKLKVFQTALDQSKTESQ